VPAGPPRIPGYTLDRLIDRKDYGPVQLSIYLAYHEASGSEVALKVLLGAEPRSGQTAVFERGARLWARLRHPRIVGLREDGSERDPPFIAMDYMGRGSLEQLLGGLQGQLLLPDESLRVFVQVAQALGELERQSIVHRAVQPSNILVAEDGGYRLSDLFLAKEIGPREEGLTRVGRVKGGSPFYMAPEQLRGSHVDARADVYGLGAVFYQLLTGRPPHSDLVEANAERLGYLGQMLSSAPLPPVPDLSALPPGLDRVIARAIDVDPSRRYSGGNELVHDLSMIGIL
jgi:serine/threonine protein kinase